MKNPCWKQTSGVWRLAWLGFLLPGAGLAETVNFQQNIPFISTSNPNQSNRYALFTPGGLQPGTNYPLVVFLHGSGNRGTDTTAASLREAAQIWARATNQLAHPLFVLAPVVPTNQLWADNTTNGVENFANTPYTMKANPTPSMRMMVELVKSLQQTQPVDPKRIYLVGESMGGYGAWEAAVRYPTLWAAVIPLMGGTDPTKAAIIKHLPIWTFHAGNDPTVPVTGTRQMVSALQAVGGHPLYTEFATGGHGISAAAVNYPAQSGNPSLLGWTYQQAKLASSANAVGNAQIIYSNDFTSGSSGVSIEGSPPTVANNVAGGNSGAQWNIVSNNASAGAYMSTDGTVGPTQNSCLLPFTPQSGYIYTLTASVTFTTDPGNWITMGFGANNPANSATPRFNDAAVSGNPWTYLRIGSAGDHFFYDRSHEVGNAQLMPTPGTYTISLKLDTTGANWIASEFINGTQVGTNYTYSANPAINAVGIGQTTVGSSVGIHWNYLTLSTALLPVITQQPLSQAVAVGGAYTNTVSVIADASGGPLFYQWFTNNVPIDGATNSSLIINPVLASDAGANYYVVVTNTCGAVTSAVVSLTVLTNVTNDPPSQLTSPNGSLVLTFAVSNFDGSASCPVYSLTRNGQTIITTSKLGLTFDSDGLLQDYLAVSSKSNSANDGTWQPVYGEKGPIRDSYSQLVVNLQETVPPYRLLQLTFRAYNEGVAFSYTIPSQTGLAGVTSLTEQTEFRFATDYPTWATYTAQGVYSKTTIGGIASGCERPLTVQLATNSYVALGEAGLVDYSRMKFAPLAGKPYSLVSLLDGPVTNSLPLTTPWRFIMAADSPGQLLENDFFVLNLNAPCALTNTFWIKPGKVIRETTLKTVSGMACVDFAAKHNIQYIEFDAGWYGPENSTLTATNAVGSLDLPGVISYAASNNIGVILYVNWKAMTNELTLLPPLYHSWGVKGIKYGFVSVGPQPVTATVNAAARICASNQMMLEVHDEFRPSGYTRTYPNFMTVEGISGDETTPTTTQDTTLLFSRMLAGGADHTVCYFEQRVTNNWNYAYQLAKAVCFYSPWQYLYWYDRPTNSYGYVNGGNAMITEVPEMEFYDCIPGVWDETRVLQGSIGQYAIIARRTGTQWFIGAMNANTTRTFSVPLNFLTPGQKYVENIYSQDPSVPTRTHVRIDRLVVDSTMTLTMTLDASRGEAVRLLPANPPVIQSVSPLTNGGFSLAIAGNIGLPYSLWTSPDLTLPNTNWTLLAGGLITTSPFMWNDILTQAQRFYRYSTP